MPHRVPPALVVAILFTNRTWSSGSTQNSQLSGPAGNFTIDANFPGGNIVVDSIKDDTVFIRPDQRDSSDWWFYWYFRVRGVAGRTLKFQFTGRKPIGTQGPAFSTDGGHTWSWLGTQAVEDSSFSYTFGRES
ncbi:MAG: M14-type cytosolic carboxypeptidase, partial [Planctomycetota bacterium]